MSISRTFVPGGQQLIRLGCAAMVATSMAGPAAPAVAADQRQPPRALWKAFPLHQRQEHARREGRADPRRPAPAQDEGRSWSPFAIGAAAAAVLALAALCWLILRRGTRSRVMRAAREHIDQIAYAGLAIVVGIGIGLFAGLYL